ncbi:MAG: response regulator transcription factor [Candidatus Sericytochromatia bacterium]|nr:response regulator transcription factor [Candidatus Tanganyikabacteria bacterium]
MAARLLVVEDEPAMARGLEEILKAREYDVVMAGRGDEAYAKATSQDFDLILLDIMLPALSGFEVLKKLRANGCEVPVILLTARGDESDKVLGFELGVDDYVTKPFSPMELLGRIGAVLRRARPPRPEAAGGDTLTFGGVTIDLRAYSAIRDGQPVELPAKGFEILRVLARTPGEAVHRDRIMDAVWGQDEYINERTLTNLAVRIRQVIEPDARQPRHLKTVHGVGYRLDM